MTLVGFYVGVVVGAGLALVVGLLWGYKLGRGVRRRALRDAYDAGASDAYEMMGSDDAMPRWPNRP